MKKTSHLWKSFACLMAMAVVGLMGTANIHAQTWEYVYGSNAAVETGFNDVQPINIACPGGGYLSVGRSFGTTTGSDVYVVRTANNGTALWEFTYDIGGLGGNDEAWGFVERKDGQGFVITGWTDGVAAVPGNGNEDIFLLAIDCQGSVVWSNTYGAPGDCDVSERAYDIIEMPALNGVACGDYIVSGYTNSPTMGAQLDAYLMRTDFNGNIIWDNRFDEGEDEWFNSLAGLTPIMGQTFGDIIAVGARTKNAVADPRQGYVVRVDGATGNFAVIPPQQAADYGSAWGKEEFHEVRETTNPGDINAAGTPNVYIAGVSDGAGSNDVYLVKIAGGDPCANLSQSTFDGGSGAGTDDRAFGLRELTAMQAGSPIYSLAITGSTNSVGAGDQDVILLTVSPIMPVPAFPGLAYAVNVATAYGSLGTTPVMGDDEGHSLYPVYTGDPAGRTEGFIICGYERSDMACPGVIDPEDEYLIKTDGNGVTTCEQVWNPAETRQNWAVGCTMPAVSPLLIATSRTTMAVSQNWGASVCPRPGVKMNPGEGVGSGFGSTQNNLVPDLSIKSVLNAYPNPVKSGNLLNVEFTPKSESEISVSVVNTLGEIVYRTTMENTGAAVEIPVNTEGWSSGTYVIKISDGEATRMGQVAVVD